MNKVQKRSITWEFILTRDKKLYKTKEALINSILNRKFGKKGKRLLKDTCDDGDACGERCFD